MVSGIDKKRLSRKDPVKDCSFLTASPDDMHHYLRLLLQKCSGTIIIHVATNNFVNESPRIVLGKIRCLKTFIHKSLP